MKRTGMITKLAIVSLAAIAIAVSVAYAQTSQTSPSGTEQGKSQGSRDGKEWGNHRGRRGGDRDGMGGMMMKSLNLTDDQKGRMEQIRQSFFDRNKSLMEELRAKHQELRQASEGATFDEALATQRLTAMAGLEAKLMGERFKLRQETLSVLTPEQKTQLEQKEAEFKAKRAERGSRKGQ